MIGIEKKIDKLGRIVLPKSYRNKLKLNCGDPVLVSLENSSIIISANKVGCALCGKQISDKAEIKLCELCITRVKRA